MEIQQILCILAIFAVGIASVAGNACSETETADLNKCLLAFVFAHHQHQEELIAAKECKLNLLNCVELDKAYKCLNSKGLSTQCTGSLEDSINKYVADLNIPCTVKEFNSHCPDVTEITNQQLQTTTSSGMTSSGTLTSGFTNTLTLAIAFTSSILTVLMK